MSNLIKKATLKRAVNSPVRELWLEHCGSEYRVYVTFDGQVSDARNVERFATLLEAELAFSQIEKE
jgi:hypothetical protein